jgi:hypothetical protein
MIQIIGGCLISLGFFFLGLTDARIAGAVLLILIGAYFFSGE